MTVKSVTLPKVGLTVKLVTRSHTKRVKAINPFHRPKNNPVPATTLPVDSSGNASCSWPMDGNDQYGDCGEAMAAHMDNTFTFGQGKAGWTESVFDETALVNQYLKVSGGDNGLDEDMVTGQIWDQGDGIAGNTAAIILDHLDIDVTNTALTQYGIDQFYGVLMAWSVPDDFITNFTTGAVFPNAGIPDPNNGHFTPLVDVADGTENSNSTPVPKGSYRIVTWGGWAWASPDFIASVQPQCFIVLSPRQFNSQGYDSKGRHATTQAKVWVACGGSASAAAALVAMFPAPGPVGPPPSPPGISLSGHVTVNKVKCPAWFGGDSESSLNGHVTINGVKCPGWLGGALTPPTTESNQKPGLSLSIITDLIQLAADAAADAPQIIADINALINDLGSLPPATWKEIQKRKEDRLKKG